MKTKTLIVVAFVAGMLLAGHPVVAQQVERIYGTVGGLPVALLATPDGILIVKCE